MKITFVMNCFDELVTEVSATVSALKHFYPDSPIILIGDGITPLPIPGTEIVSTNQRVKTAEFGGAWSHRYLTEALNRSDFDLLIKVDPDTQVLGIARDLPSEDCVFCSVRETPLTPDRLYRVPHGGALGYTRKIAQALVDEKLFLNEKFKNNIRYRASNDIMLMDIVFWSMIKLVDRPDFACGKTKKRNESTVFFHP